MLSPVRRYSFLLLTWAAAATAQPGPAIDPAIALRAQFVEALAGVARGLPAEDDAESLRGYALYPWLQSERLLRDLKLAPEPPDEAIAALLASQGDLPATRGLRAAWLKSLAERALWPQYLAYYLDARADTALRCHQISALAATGADPALRDSALAIWRTGAELPAPCAAVFDWLRTQGALTAVEIATRTRLALEGGKPAVARMLIRQLPEADRAVFTLWAEVLEDPRRNLERAAARRAEPRALRDGYAKLARADEDIAAAVLSRIETACGQPCTLATPATISELRSERGLSQAWSRRPETVGTFLRVPDSQLDERGFEWRARAALWSGAWAQAASWIAQMPPALAGQPRWRYWRARTAQKLDRTEAARAEYERLAQENGYYSVLAAERLDRGYTPRTQLRSGDPAIREIMASAPAFLRAREAFLIDQPAWARSEWNDATAGLGPAQLLEAARVASSWGWHLQAVATATRAEVFDDFELLYPRPYEFEVSGSAKRARLPPEWIYGVLRQESLYDPRARSSADALGLLQLLPETARAVARRAGLGVPTRNDLFDPSTNVLLGAGYLREQFDTFGGRFVLVLGAYNAGPNAVRRWLPETPLDTDVWIENVPFNETRTYIQRIVWHSTVFAWRASGKPQRLTPWLTPISSDLTPLPQAPYAPTVMTP